MVNRKLIKVCGLRDDENIRQVAALGVDWIGMIFWDRSPRNVTMIPTHAGIIPDRGNLPPAPSEGDLTPAPSEGRGSELPQAAHGAPLRVGVFVDEMAQNIITRVVNFQLDLIQLHGHETPTLIRNLRRTLDPAAMGDSAPAAMADGAPTIHLGAIRPGIKFIKAISVSSADDIALYKQYEDCVDYFLFDTKCQTVGGSGQQFDWSILADYDGEKPFLLSGGIGPDDATRLRSLFASSATAVGGFPADKCIGIDLNSRFETAPGLKDIDALKHFLTELQN